MPTNEVRVPQQDRARRTRASLLEAARAEFSRHGYAKTTARSIAKQAGVATGTFYQYFADKDATLTELLDVRLQQVRDRIMGLVAKVEAPHDVAAQLNDVVSMVIELHRDDPGLHAVLTERRAHDAALDALQLDSEKLMVAQVATLLRLWSGSDARDHEATAVVVVGMIEGSVHAHVLGHAMVDDDRFHAALVDALVRVATPMIA